MKRTYINPTSSKVVFVNHNLLLQSSTQGNTLELQIDRSSLDDEWGCAKAFTLDKALDEEEQIGDDYLW